MMDKNKTYLTSLSALLLSTVVILSALGEARLDVYISLFTVEYFAVSALFQPRRRFFDVLGGALFLIFSFIVGIKIWEIIQ
jgi:hypothetical protein